jgi:hypothetical protein
MVFSPRIEVNAVMPSHALDFWRSGEHCVQRFSRCGGNLAMPSAKERRDEPRAALDPADPQSVGRFVIGAKADHTTVRAVRDCEVEVPAKVFLTRLRVRGQSPCAQTSAQPSRDIIAETAGIDEILAGRRSVERRALKSENGPHIYRTTHFLFIHTLHVIGPAVSSATGRPASLRASFI